MITDIEELENLDASEICPRRLNGKEVLTPQRGENFIFSDADGTAESSGRDYEFREPTPRREQPVRSEDLSGETQGESGESQPTEPTDDAEARKDFSSSSTLSILAQAIFHSKCREDALLECSIFFPHVAMFVPSLPLSFFSVLVFPLSARGLPSSVMSC